jgi:predicted translin family RNA/ssDNA-binding protein
MLAKFFKYAMLVEAEIVLRVAKKVQEASEDFVRKNADEEYEQSLTDLFDGFDEISQKVKNISPKLEKVTDSVNKFKDNILDFPKRANM